ncbi:hypothetical protein BKA67DRAFT_533012 [Truncatella angustata]|uniref:Transmembrane protein n=1 Tax=Truncatella angustata TaxID=152316 RepID=A0A9P8UT25_9PEZI|nr:uncharacterized protein BKA67DRAFT_533012 [Truncatella angustata]KAH6657823.1 hypothetical protein BKA67DRAFT_533012 [Truncatella angustata]
MIPISFVAALVAFGLKAGPWAWVINIIAWYLLSSPPSWFPASSLIFVVWFALLLAPPLVLARQGKSRSALVCAAALLVASLEVSGFWYRDWEWEECLYLVWGQLLGLAYFAQIFVRVVFAYLIVRIFIAIEYAMRDVDAAHNDNVAPPRWFAYCRDVLLVPWSFGVFAGGLVLLGVVFAAHGLSRVCGRVVGLWSPSVPARPMRRHRPHLAGCTLPSLPKCAPLRKSDKQPQTSASVHRPLRRELMTLEEVLKLPPQSPLPRGTFGGPAEPPRPDPKTGPAFFWNDIAALPPPPLSLAYPEANEIMTHESPSDQMDWRYDCPAPVMRALSPVVALLPAPAVLAVEPASVVASAPAPEPEPVAVLPVTTVLAVEPARAAALAPVLALEPEPVAALPAPADFAVEPAPVAFATPPAIAESSDLDAFAAELEAAMMNEAEFDELLALPSLPPVFDFGFSFALPAGAPAAPTGFSFGEPVAAPERATANETVEVEEEKEEYDEKEWERINERAMDRASRDYSPCPLSDELPDTDDEKLDPEDNPVSFGSIPKHLIVTPTFAPTDPRKYR